MDDNIENVKNMSLATIKDFLVIDQDDTDNDSLIKIFWQAAKSRVETLTHRNFKDWINPPADITIACLILTQHFFDKRSTENISSKVRLSVLDLIEPYYNYGDHWTKALEQQKEEEKKAVEQVQSDFNSKNSTGVHYSEWL